MTLSAGRVAPILAVVALLLSAWLVIMPHVGTTAGQPGKAIEPARARDTFASASPAVPASISPATFDGKRALGYIEQLCKIGPRLSGTDGMKQQQDLIKAHFEKLGAKVEFQKFQGKQISQPAPVEMTNIIISWYPDRERRVLICSHYDTRPNADQEPDRNNWSKPFASANDGTSGVAWLMELGNHMKQLPLAVGVDFVLFDGEEYVFDGAGPRSKDKYFFGSEHFADEYKKDHKGHYYAAGVLLDLCAGKDAVFPVERNSWFQAGGVVREIWGTAKELKVTAFQEKLSDTPVNDDHIALNAVSIPTIDLIDFSYRNWHRLSDTPDKCSPATMETVSKVLTVWLQNCR